MKATTNGYAYDLKKANEIIARIEALAGLDMLAYAHTEPTAQTLLRNEQAPAWVFVVIGFRADPGNVGFPCIMRNEETGQWGWSRNLILSGEGLCWDNGNYLYGPDAERIAWEEFEKDCTGVLYRLEDY